MHMNRDIRTTIFRVCLVGLLAAVGAFADAITGTGTWQAFPGTLDLDGYPYVDRPSGDGLRGSAAFYLSGYGGSYGARSLGVTPDWYGETSGEAATDYYFNLAQANLTATLRLENSEWRLNDEFGWYDVSNPTILHTLFAGPASVGAIVTFTPSVQYGYYLTSAYGETYYTQSSLNPSGDATQQHFALFRSTDPTQDKIWVGAEDLPVRCAAYEMGGDYNDMVVEIVGTPEPATGFLAGGTLLALAMGIRWARSKRTR
jgi:hypothetical protein